MLVVVLLPASVFGQADYSSPYTITTLAGSAGYPGTNDGIGSVARFNHPDGVAVDSAGNIYVAHTFNHTIRKVTPAGVVTTLAGLAHAWGTNDGTGSAARFYYPYGVAVDSAANLYVTDTLNYTIRKATLFLQFDTSTGSLSVSNGLFQMRLIGPSGSNVVVEASANLQALHGVRSPTVIR